jgi:hypothetical protein
MRNSGQVIVGLVLAFFGGVFFFQGIGVIKGSVMTNTVTWSVLGPLLALGGLALAAKGARGRERSLRNVAGVRAVHPTPSAFSIFTWVSVVLAAFAKPR